MVKCGSNDDWIVKLVLVKLKSNYTHKLFRLVKLCMRIVGVELSKNVVKWNRIASGSFHSFTLFVFSQSENYFSLNGKEWNLLFIDYNFLFFNFFIRSWAIEKCMFCGLISWKSATVRWLISIEFGVRNKKDDWVKGLIHHIERNRERKR